MKYYHEQREYDGALHDYGYNINQLPVNQPLWAVAYHINNETGYVKLRSLPVRGEIRKWERFNGADFFPYKKNSTEVRQTGKVDYQSRMYADTEEEAFEMYNELVQKRIEALYKMIEEAKEDFIVRL